MTLNLGYGLVKQLQSHPTYYYAGPPAVSPYRNLLVKHSHRDQELLQYFTGQRYIHTVPPLFFETLLHSQTVRDSGND
ncbi:hypothetical protein M404DRAFT_995791 [Pisolithus tinctorius Marx 270]|uniref:Uncharacterized protein n=1 Tax=Pisolithus tinctorius Marx 270 TaxID=870435 RepID=A0A0C3KLV7_PISTI|nr:hypothetical protein M404DRAFT_995791 [Pisolithus tinctorius Marx 270]